MSLKMNYWKFKSLFERELIIKYRSLSSLIFTIISPLIYLFVFGLTLSNIVIDLSYNGQPIAYISYLVPGIAIISIIMASTGTGTSVFVERAWKTIHSLLACPIKRNYIIISKIMVSTIVIAVQGMLFLILGSITVAKDISISPETLFIAIGVIIYISIGFSCLYVAIASLIKDNAVYNGITSFFTIPMMFISTAYYPISRMPSLLQNVAAINPVSFASNMLRGVLLGGDTNEILWSAIGFGIFTIIFMIVALSLFGRKLD